MQFKATGENDHLAPFVAPPDVVRPDVVRPDAAQSAEKAESSPDLTERLTDWALRSIEAYPRPRIPIDRPWEASLAGLVRQAPFVPAILTKPLALFDRLGALHLSPDDIGFDGEEVDWDRVEELRLQSVVSCLTSAALESQVGKIASYLPPVPGRTWAARTFASLLASLYLAVVPLEEDGTMRLPGDADGDVLVVTAIVRARRGLSRAGVVEASTAAALLQLAMPEATAAMVAAGKSRGVPVTELALAEGAIGREVSRAEVWREQALRMRRRRDEARTEDEDSGLGERAGLTAAADGAATGEQSDDEAADPMPPASRTRAD